MASSIDAAHQYRLEGLDRGLLGARLKGLPGQHGLVLPWHGPRRHAVQLQPRSATSTTAQWHQIRAVRWVSPCPP